MNITYDWATELQTLCLCAAFLFFKMWASGWFTVMARRSEGRPAAPEDHAVGVKAKKEAKASAAGLSGVERGLAAHRNDLENIPIFLVLAILLFISGPHSSKNSHFAHILYLAIFTAARLVHTLAYLVGVQPYRSLSFGVGILVSAVAACHLVMQVLNLKPGVNAT